MRLRFRRHATHFDPANVLRIAEAATVAVGRNDLHATAADFLHHTQGARTRDLQPVFGQRETIHRLIGAQPAYSIPPFTPT